MLQSMARLRSRTRHGAVELTEPSGSARTPGTAMFVLVGDVADDLLDDILERHQPFHLAVFVNHQRETASAVGGTPWSCS